MGQLASTATRLNQGLAAAAALEQGLTAAGAKNQALMVLIMGITAPAAIRIVGPALHWPFYARPPRVWGHRRRRAGIGKARGVIPRAWT